MSLRSVVVGQFKHPHGPLGRLAGFTMANRPSNRERNRWTVGLLDLEPDHRVLEIGCGPGIALEACAARLAAGRVVGIDHSEIMVRRARRRLVQAIEAGRAEVRLGDLEESELEPDSYDRVYSLNVVQFLPDIVQAFRQMYHCIAPAGMAATTFQPRSRRPRREDALDMAARIETAMETAGFSGIKRHELPLDPVPAICVTGRK